MNLNLIASTLYLGAALFISAAPASAQQLSHTTDGLLEEYAGPVEMVRRFEKIDARCPLELVSGNNRNQLFNYDWLPYHGRVGFTSAVSSTYAVNQYTALGEDWGIALVTPGDNEPCEVFFVDWGKKDHLPINNR